MRTVRLAAVSTEKMTIAGLETTTLTGRLTHLAEKYAATWCIATVVTSNVLNSFSEAVAFNARTFSFHSFDDDWPVLIIRAATYGDVPE